MSGNMILEDQKDKISSLLLGLAVGDALGVPVEFRPRGSFRVTDMQGYGTHNQPPGTWSDDTSLALCLADSLSRGFSPEDMARNFVRWRDEAAFTAHGAVFDIGISTAKAISRLKSGIAPEQAGCAGVNENGNGSLMRIAPLVFYLDGKPEAERFNITRAVSSITHAHPWSVAACFIYLKYLWEILNGHGKLGAYANLKANFREGSPYLGADVMDRFARILRADIRTLPESAIKSGGFVIDTLEAAFWCFLTTDTYQAAVLKAVNLGDDTDTTAAVTGALAGLAYGLEGIPTAWLKTLAGSKDIRRLAGAMANALPG
ncbi:MAG: ADP-ribosylglycohydrolase family protein [Treponema sp.]|jgi:ADP-ribosylglycohydrolase|nr:ADP-ribosylglycohydrolase family protein [Treponema sp.]